MSFTKFNGYLSKIIGTITLGAIIISNMTFGNNDPMLNITCVVGIGLLNGVDLASEFKLKQKTLLKDYRKEILDKLEHEALKKEFLQKELDKL